MNAELLAFILSDEIITTGHESLYEELASEEWEEGTATYKCVRRAAEKYSEDTRMTWNYNPGDDDRIEVGWYVKDHQGKYFKVIDSFRDYSDQRPLIILEEVDFWRNNNV